MSSGVPFGHLGDAAIWQLPKNAFLCSRKVPAAQVLKCYDWAIAMREAGRCVMLGAHSQLEKDVLHYLLKGRQPVVLVLARTMVKRLDPALEPKIAQGSLLLVAPPGIRTARVTRETAAIRNRFLVQHAQEVVCGHVDPSGSLATLLAEAGVRPKVL
ncbi:MAG: hypothetical protein J5I62_10090 [Flavobacteriales bacterium]|nr:hypothetical protein [Flavobacteriales bacterium]MEB2342947.1 DNA-binding protein [Flavobacteriia bacterium]